MYRSVESIPPYGFGARKNEKAEDNERERALKLYNVGYIISLYQITECPNYRTLKLQ